MGTRASRIFSDLFVDLQASANIPVVALVFVLDVLYSFELTVHESSHLTVMNRILERQKLFCDPQWFVKFQVL